MEKPAAETKNLARVKGSRLKTLLVTKLKTNVLRQSKGATIGKGDTILVRYDGTFVESGERFDATYDFTTFNTPIPTLNYTQLDGAFLLQATPAPPFEFVLGAGEVIKGWDKAFQKGRRLGEVIDLTIPSDLAYGEEGRPNIPPNSDLRFKVEVLAARAKGADPADPPLLPDLSDLGVDIETLGLKTSELDDLNSVKIGLKGADRIIGDNSKDLLIGLGGKDKLFGAGGADVLIGGKGANRYRYTDIADSAAGNESQDSIYGFSNKDKINLRGLNAELNFIGADKFSGAAGDLRFHNETLKLDLDGDASADFAISLPGTENLKASNLIL